MSLYDHLRELRYRVVVSVLAVVVTAAVAAFFYRTVLNLVMWP
jgi:sec-independent protein translocase protein TatC